MLHCQFPFIFHSFTFHFTMSFPKRASAVDVFLKRLKQNGHQYFEGFSRERELKDTK